MTEPETKEIRYAVTGAEVTVDVPAALERFEARKSFPEHFEWGAIPATEQVWIKHLNGLGAPQLEAAFAELQAQLAAEQLRIVFLTEPEGKRIG